MSIPPPPPTPLPFPFLPFDIRSLFGIHGAHEQPRFFDHSTLNPHPNSLSSSSMTSRMWYCCPLYRSRRSIQALKVREDERLYRSKAGFDHAAPSFS